MAVGLSTVAFLALTLTPTIDNTNTASATSSSFNLGISEVLSLSIEAYDESTSSYTNNSNLSMSIIPGTFKTASARITADTNAPYGYHLVLSNNDSNNALAEQNDNPSSPTSPVISSITTDTTIADTTDSTKLFPDNTWGYNLTDTSSTNTTSNATPSTTPGTTSNTTPPTIPLTYSKIPTDTTSSTIATTENLGTATYTFTTGARVDKVLPAGIYKDKLVFSIIANAAPLAPSFYTTYYMQDFNQTACNSVKTPTSDIKEVTDKYGSNYHDNGTNATIVPSTILIDKRDNQEYTIRKLADGNCWMTENLRIGKEGAITLDSTNSNMTAGRTFDLPKADTTPGKTWGNQDEFPFVFYRESNPNSTSPNGIKADGPSGLYNWYTTTAGALDSDDNSLMEADSGEAVDSICPKEWKLPTRGSDYTTDKTYMKLGYVYTGATINSKTYITTNPAQAAINEARIEQLIEEPTNFLFVDRYYNLGGSLSSRSLGMYWESSVKSENEAHYLILNTSGTERTLHMQGYNSKGYGCAVRCVLAS